MAGELPGQLDPYVWYWLSFSYRRAQSCIVTLNFFPGKPGCFMFLERNTTKSRLLLFQSSLDISWYLRCLYGARSISVLFLLGNHANTHVLLDFPLGR